MRALLASLLITASATTAFAQSSDQALRLVDHFAAIQKLDPLSKKRVSMLGITFSEDLKAIWDRVTSLDEPGWTSPIMNYEGNGFRVVNRTVVSDMCAVECAVRVNLIAETPEAPRHQTAATTVVFLIVENGQWKIDDVLYDGKRLFKSGLKANFQ
jgi:hypothetical protein